MTIKRTLLILLLLLIAAVQGLAAHPHMMLSNRCVVHWEGEAVRGVTFEWVFDKFFSADIRFYYDIDKNGLYDETETQEVFHYAFSNLERYNYFVFFRRGSRRFTPERIENFTVRNLGEETLMYSFYVPLAEPAEGELNIAVYDYSFFCHVKYDEESPLRLEFEEGAVQPAYELRENRDYPVYYDPFAPMSDLSLHEEWRPGLETFYPTEIQLVF